MEVNITLIQMKRRVTNTKLLWALLKHRTICILNYKGYGHRLNSLKSSFCMIVNPLNHNSPRKYGNAIVIQICILCARLAMIMAWVQPSALSI